jgi:NAD(P)H-hydrate epimerase
MTAETARAVVELDDAYVARLQPRRDARAHKGSNGKVLAICGSLDYLGAALLVARAAGRAGAGLVSLAIPASLQPLAAGRVPEATTHGLPETDVEGEVDAELAMEWILDFDHDSLVVGPGLRPGLATVELVHALLDGGESFASGERGGGSSGRRDGAERLPPAVFDAEALNSLASVGGWPERLRRPAILTPHPGEFRRLSAGEEPADNAEGPDLGTDDDARLEAAAEAARRWRTVVVLKGAKSVIAGPDGRICRAPFENPALGTGGTGDVLAGIVAALLAQGVEPFDAACLGVYLHGVAGDAIRERLGDAGLLASDLPDEVARARRRLAGVRKRLAGDRRLGFRVPADQ